MKISSSLHTFFFLIILLIFSSSYAQQSNYNLLWKIEGGNFSKPSYLFGTMHVKDARAFNFSDSVMTSIEKCEIFALEVHPDSMVSAMFNKSLDRDTSNTLRKLLSEEDYQKLKVRFEELNGYEIDKLKSKNPMVIKSLLSKDSSREDNKQTFVDAYLYGIAKTMNKKIEGLEQIQTQIDFYYDLDIKKQKEIILEMLDYDTEKQKGFKDAFIDVYGSGNIGVIEDFIGKSILLDSIMIERNKVMLKRIKELGKDYSTFSAVGTAHLIGDFGLIKMLEAEGYKVFPVKATFTGVADSYKIDLLKMDWPVQRDEEMGFSFSMPGTPFPIEKFDQIKMLMYQDLSTSAVYSVYSIDYRNSKMGYSEDEVVKKFLTNYKQNAKAKIIKKKRVDKDGFSALEVILKSNDNIYFKLQVIIRNNVFYCLFAGGKLDQLNQPYITKFFDSFESFTPPPQKSKEWLEFKDEKGAFTSLFPGKAKKTTKEVPYPGLLEEANVVFHLIMSLDLPTMTNYLIGYNDMPLGYYIEDVNESFTGLIDELAGKAEVLSVIDTIWLDGVEGREIEMMLANKYYTVCRIFIRGNRVYKILKQNLKEGERAFANEDDFFSSFSFAPYQKPDMQLFEPKGENFSFLQFSESRIEIDSVDDFEGYIKDNTMCFSTNSNSGGVYLFEYFKLSEFFKIEHIDTFYNDYINNALLGWTDSLVSVDSVFMDGVYGKEILLENTLTKGLSRCRLWIDGDNGYLTYGYLSRDELFSDETNSFFESFKKVENKEIEFDIYASKTDKIILGLNSLDSIIYLEALGALTYYDFTVADLPFLHKEIKKSFSDDSLLIGVRSKLIESIGEVSDESSLDELILIYKNENTPNQIKTIVLECLIDFKEQKGIPTFMDLFLNNPPTDMEYQWKIFSVFRDSLKLAYEHFDKLLAMETNNTYRNSLLSLAITLVNSDSLPYVELIELNFDKLTAEAFKDLEKYKEDILSKDEEYFYSPEIYNYLSLMSLVKGRALSDKFTNEIINMENNTALLANAVAVRIKNDLSISKKINKTLLESLDTRFILINAYNDAGKLIEVPKKYLIKSELAKIYLRDFIFEEDYSYPEGIKLLGEINYNDTIVYVYSFVVDYEGEKETYMGMSGGFLSESTTLDLKSLKAYTDWNLIDKEWRKQAELMLSDYKEFGY